MHTELKTDRLLLDTLVNSDMEFIFQLLNSKSWLKNIGDRHIHSNEDALGYIKKIRNNSNFTYWVIRIKNNLTPIGVVSFIKRDYLKNYDVGYALLPQFQGQGFAFEATKEILRTMIREPEHSKILATTLPENAESIKLLQRLGFQFVEEMEIENERLNVYSVDKLHLNKCGISH